MYFDNGFLPSQKEVEPFCLPITIVIGTNINSVFDGINQLGFNTFLNMTMDCHKTLINRANSKGITFLTKLLIFDETNIS